MVWCVGESLALHGRPSSLEKGAASPKSPRRKRTAKMGRVDYATMEALADLNYAMNRGTQAAVLLTPRLQTFDSFCCIA